MHGLFYVLAVYCLLSILAASSANKLVCVYVLPQILPGMGKLIANRAISCLKNFNS